MADVTQSPNSGTAEVNGAQIYYELRGSGPSVLFIAYGDAEPFAGCGCSQLRSSMPISRRLPRLPLRIS